jgi:hypothetical protein
MENVQPVAAELIYYNEPDYRTQNTATLLGIFALVIGIVAMIADLGQLIAVATNINGMMGFYRSQPIYFAQFFSGMGFSLAQHTIMMAGGAMVLARRRIAWNLMIAYAFVSIAHSAVSLVLSIAMSVIRGPTPGGAIQGIWTSTNSLALTLFMIIVIAILRRPVVREMFEKAIVRPSRPPGLE